MRIRRNFKNMREETYSNIKELIKDCEEQIRTQLLTRIKLIKDGEKNVWKTPIKISHVAFCQSGKSIGIPTIISCIHNIVQELKTELEEVDCWTLENNNPISGWIRMGTTDKSLIEQHINEDKSVLRNFTYTLDRNYRINEMVCFEYDYIYHNSKTQKKRNELFTKISKEINNEKVVVFIDDESHRGTGNGSRWDSLYGTFQSLPSSVPKFSIHTTATPDYLSEQEISDEYFNVLLFQKPGLGYWGFRDMLTSKRFVCVDKNFYDLKTLQSSDKFVEEELLRNWMWRNELGDYKYFVFRLGNDQNGLKNERYYNLVESINKIFTINGIEVPEIREFDGDNYNILLDMIGGNEKHPPPNKNYLFVIKNGLSAGVNIDKSNLGTWFETVESGCEGDTTSIYGNISTHIQRLGRVAGYGGGDWDFPIYGSMRCVEQHCQFMDMYEEGIKNLVLNNETSKLSVHTGSNVKKIKKVQKPTLYPIKVKSLNDENDKPSLETRKLWYNIVGEDFKPRTRLGKVRSKHKNLDLGSSLLVSKNFSSYIQHTKRRKGKDGKEYHLILVKFDKKDTDIPNKGIWNDLKQSQWGDLQNKWSIVICEERQPKPFNKTKNNTFHCK